MPTEPANTGPLPWYLAHAALNSVFALWTFGGSVFVLFLGELGIGKGFIGLLLSLFPFCGILALGFAPLAGRLGRKRVFLVGYGTRKLVMALLLLLPWTVARHGHAAAIVFLSAVIVVFAILRALAETAYYPWSQEFIANSVRGRFAAYATVVGMIASAGALATAGTVMDYGQGLGRYQLLFGAGTFAGIAGVLVMLKIPGGKPLPESGRPADHWRNMRLALSDRNFLAYLGGMAGNTIGAVMLLSFLPLYLKERYGLPAATIVRLDIVMMVGGALASLGCGWLSDRLGSRPILMPAAALFVLLPLGWLLLPRQAPAPILGCAVLFFGYGVASNGVIIGAGRLLFNGVVPPAQNTAYTAIHYAWIGLFGGLAPLIGGAILTLFAHRRAHLGALVFDGYALLFATAFVCLAAGWYLYGRVRPDGRYSTRTALRHLVIRLTQR